MLSCGAMDRLFSCATMFYLAKGGSSCKRDVLVIKNVLFCIIQRYLNMLFTGRSKPQHAHTVWGIMWSLQTKDFTSLGWAPSWESRYEHSVLCWSKDWDSVLTIFLFLRCFWWKIPGVDPDLLRVSFSAYWHGLPTIDLSLRMWLKMEHFRNVMWNIVAGTQ